MDIISEKQEIIRRFNLIHDIDLIKAIKSLLDFGMHRQGNEDIDEELEASIKQGLWESDNGIGIPHEDVMADIKKRYNL